MKDWTIDIAEKWIDILQTLDKDGYLSNPHGIWNLDETGFSLGEMWRRVYAIKGTKQVLSSSDYDSKQLLTVLAGGNAAGLMCRPLVLYDGRLQISSRFDGTEDKVLIGVNRSGWMDNEYFAAFVREELLPKITADKVL